MLWIITACAFITAALIGGALIAAGIAELLGWNGPKRKGNHNDV